MLRNNAPKSLNDSRGLVKSDPLLPIPISLLIASVLTVYPMSSSLSIWRPEFMLMLTLFWVMNQPKWCGVWFAFVIGFMTDLILDSHLGSHAFVFVLLTFAATFLTRNKRMLTFPSRWIIAAIVIFFNFVVFFLFNRMSGNIVPLWFWSPIIPSILAWPLICFLLKRWGRA
jgi:rod shape-determining protein MreD